MNNTKKVQLLQLCIIAFLITLTACGHTQKQQSQRPSTKKRLSDKIDPKTRYPHEWYITATGSGDTKESAEKKAVNGIAQTIKVDIKSQQLLVENYIEKGTSDNMKLQATTSFTNQIDLTTQQSLKNINIEKTWISDKDGMYYAFAYMDRSETSDILVKDLGILDKDISTYYQGMQDSQNKLTALAYINKALSLAIERDIKSEQLNSISLGSREYTPVIKSTKLIGARHDLTKTIGVMLDLKFDKWDEFPATIAEVLGAYGLRIVDINPDILVTGKMNMEHLERKGYFVRWYVELHFTETAANSEFLTYSDDSREGHKSYGEAERRAAKRMSVALRKDLYKKFGEHLESMLGGK